MTVTRTIKTRLAIEGEAEYQSKMQQCSAAIKETASVLDLVTAKYAENESSIEALTAKGDVLQRMYDQQAEKAKLAAEALENARKAQDDHAKSVMDTRDKLADAEKRMQEYADAGEQSSEAQEALNRELEELRKQLTDSESMYDAATRGVTKWQTEVNKAEAAMYKTGDALRKNNEALEQVGEDAEDAGDAMGDLGNEFDLSSLSIGSLLDKAKEINPVLGAAASGAIAAGKAVYDMAEEYYDAASVIGKATGALGDDLYELTDIAYRAAGQVDATLDDVAAAVGEINTRYGLIGKDLEDLTALFANFADVNNVDVVNAVQNVSKIMRNYGVATEDAERLMDMLTVAAQKSGIAFNSLSSQLLNGKAQFMEFGYSLEESIALIAMAELEGLNLNSMLQGFRTAATEAAKSGKELPRMLEDTIDAIEEAATEQEALNIATEAFGTRAAQEMLLAIRSGRFEIEEWVAALEDSEGAMMKSGDATDTFGDKWQQLKNSISAGVVEVKNLFEQLSGATADALTDSEEMLEGAVVAYDTQSEHIEAAGAVVQRYAMRLQELEAQGELTAAQQAEYNELVARINALMPELNLKIDEQTGLLEGGTEALLDNIDAWVQFAEQQAKMEFKQDAIDALTEALREENSLLLERKQIENDLAAAQAAYDTEWEKHKDRVVELNEQMTKYMPISDQFQDELDKIYKEMGPLSDAIAEQERLLEDNADALETNAETQEKAKETLEILGETYENVNDAFGDTSGLQDAEQELENYAEQITDTANEGIAALEALQAEYDEAYASAYASIDGQLGKWKEFKEVTAQEAADAVDAINRALDSQIAYLAEYTENFNDLMSRDIEGIDILAEKLSDGSEESAAILEGLTELTDEEIKAIIEKLEGVEEGKEAFAEEVALMETDYEERMQQIEDQTGQTMEDLVSKMNAAAGPAHAAGVNVGSKFNEGLSSKLDEARQIAAEFQGIFDGMMAGLDEMKSTTGGGGHSHATGLYSVPYDEYPAILHKGERVLTAAEARIYNEQEKYGNTDNSKTVNVGGITINGESDRKTIRAVERAIRKAVR